VRGIFKICNESSMKRRATKTKQHVIEKLPPAPPRKSWLRTYSHVAYFLSTLNLFVFPARANVQGAPLTPPAHYVRMNAYHAGTCASETCSRAPENTFRTSLLHETSALQCELRTATEATPAAALLLPQQQQLKPSNPCAHDAFEPARTPARFVKVLHARACW